MKVDPLERRLRFWLWLMELCERADFTDTPIYFFFVRRAAGCNRWKGPKP